MTKLELIKMLDRHSFQFAKSMPFIPHWYTLRKNWDNREFDKAVQYVREFGYVGNFGKTKYTYFNANGYKYWSMGYPVEETILINKARQKYNTLYNDIANTYDYWYTTPECHLENNEIIGQLKIKNHTAVLDIGCGTGLFLDYLTKDTYIDYLGIDPSYNMLEKLKEKHIDYEKNVMCCSFEDFYTVENYDYVISLFGSPSYIKAESLNKLYDLCVDKKYFLMFYKDGYLPKYEEHLDIEVLNSNKIVDLADDLDAETYHWNQFLIVKNI